jgi:hypothetical protein
VIETDLIVSLFGVLGFFGVVFRVRTAEESAVCGLTEPI